MSRTLPLPGRMLPGRLNGDQYCGPCAACVAPSLRYFGPRPPLWRIDVEMLGRIVRQQSLLAQPLCLPAYRRALAVQPFGNLRSRICRPQGNKFAEFLVGPAGHGRPRSWRPQRLLPCLPIRAAPFWRLLSRRVGEGSEPLANQRAPDNLSMPVIEFRVSAQWVLARIPLGEKSAGEFLARRPRRIVEFAATLPWHTG